MARNILAGLLLCTTLVFWGCEEVAKDDPRFQIEPAELAAAASPGFSVPQATEVDMVENMATKRADYAKALEDLIAYYNCSGDVTKCKWAQKELEILKSVPKYRFLMAAEVAGPNLSAADVIAEADQMFCQAQELNSKARGLMITVDEPMLREALAKYNDVIRLYPSSDKIDDAAFRAAEIYEYFKDYEIAAVYYQRAYQWDASTPYPARFKAANNLDNKLHQTCDALTLYKLAYQCETRYTGNTEYAKNRVIQLTRTYDQLKAKAEIKGNK